MVMILSGVIGEANDSIEMPIFAALQEMTGWHLFSDPIMTSGSMASSVRILNVKILTYARLAAMSSFPGGAVSQLMWHIEASDDSVDPYAPSGASACLPLL